MTGRYRQWVVAKWDRDPFRSLTPLQRYMYLTLYLGPYSYPVPGVSVCGSAALAEVAGDVPDFAEHLQTMVSAGVVRYEGRLFVLPDVLVDAEPENPNQVKAWRKGFNELPGGALKDEIDTVMRDLLVDYGNAHPVTLKDGRLDPGAYARAWDRTFVERSANVRPRLVEGSANVPRTSMDDAANVPATLVEPEEGEGEGEGEGTEAGAELPRGKSGGAGGEKPAVYEDYEPDDIRF